MAGHTYALPLSGAVAHRVVASDGSILIQATRPQTAIWRVGQSGWHVIIDRRLMRITRTLTEALGMLDLAEVRRG